MVVGSRSFSKNEVEALIQTQPEVVRVRYLDDRGKREFVDQVVRTELLVQEARRRGFDRDPEVKASFERLLVQKLTASLEPVRPEDATLRRFYDEHRSEFVRPERLHLSAIFVEAPEGSPGRAQAMKDASTWASEVKGLKPADGATAFARMAAEHSTHAPSRTSAGDVGPRTPEDLEALFGRPLREPLDKMKAPGDVVGPISTDRGVVILRLTGRQPGSETTFESVRDRIEWRLLAEARLNAVNALLTDLKAKTPVTIDEKALHELDAKAPAGPLLEGIRPEPAK